jgi:hypothetical protein
MIYIAFRLEVFLGPRSFPTPVFKWVDVLPTDTNRCVRVDCVGRPRPLSRRNGSGGKEGFVLRLSFFALSTSFLIFRLWELDLG